MNDPYSSYGQIRSALSPITTHYKDKPKQHLQLSQENPNKVSITVSPPVDLKKTSEDPKVWLPSIRHFEFSSNNLNLDVAANPRHSPRPTSPLLNGLEPVLANWDKDLMKGRVSDIPDLDIVGLTALPSLPDVSDAPRSPALRSPAPKSPRLNSPNPTGLFLPVPVPNPDVFVHPDVVSQGSNSLSSSPVKWDRMMSPRSQANFPPSPNHSNFAANSYQARAGLLSLPPAHPSPPSSLSPSPSPESYSSRNRILSAAADLIPRHHHHLVPVSPLPAPDSMPMYSSALVTAAPTATFRTEPMLVPVAAPLNLRPETLGFRSEPPIIRPEPILVPTADFPTTQLEAVDPNTHGTICVNAQGTPIFTTKFEEPISGKPTKKCHRRRPVTVDKSTLYCHRCGTKNTPEWRRGPQGPATLCNACGLNFAKRQKREDEILNREKKPVVSNYAILPVVGPDSFDQQKSIGDATGNKRPHVFHEYRPR